MNRYICQDLAGFLCLRNFLKQNILDKQEYFLKTSKYYDLNNRVRKDQAIGFIQCLSYSEYRIYSEYHKIMFDLQTSYSDEDSIFQCLFCDKDISMDDDEVWISLAQHNQNKLIWCFRYLANDQIHNGLLKFYFDDSENEATLKLYFNEDGSINKQYCCLESKEYRDFEKLFFFII